MTVDIQSATAEIIGEEKRKKKDNGVPIPYGGQKKKLGCSEETVRSYRPKYRREIKMGRITGPCGTPGERNIMAENWL